MTILLGTLQTLQLMGVVLMIAGLNQVYYKEEYKKRKKKGE